MEIRHVELGSGAQLGPHVMPPEEIRVLKHKKMPITILVVAFAKFMFVHVIICYPHYILVQSLFKCWIQLFHSLNHSKSLLLLACVSCIWHVNPKSLFKPQILPNPCCSLKSTTYLASNSSQFLTSTPNCASKLSIILFWET